MHDLVHRSKRAHATRFLVAGVGVLLAGALITGGAAAETRASTPSQADIATSPAGVGVQGWALYNGRAVNLAALLDRPGDVACHGIRRDGVATCFDTTGAMFQDLVRLEVITPEATRLAISRGFLTPATLEEARRSPELSSRHTYLADAAIFPMGAPCCSGLFDGWTYTGDSYWFQASTANLGAFNNRASSFLYGFSGSWQVWLEALKNHVQKLMLLYTSVSQITGLANNNAESLTVFQNV